MDHFRLELVIGFALVALVLVPAVVVRLLDRKGGRTTDKSLSGSRSSPALSVKPEAATGRTCPFCKDTIAAGSVHIECATCATWHHATCFEENQGCAVFGCKEKRGVGRADRQTG